MRCERLRFAELWVLPRRRRSGNRTTFSLVRRSFQWALFWERAQACSRGRANEVGCLGRLKNEEPQARSLSARLRRPGRRRDRLIARKLSRARLGHAHVAQDSSSGVVTPALQELQCAETEVASPVAAPAS